MFRLSGTKYYNSMKMWKRVWSQNKLSKNIWHILWENEEINMQFYTPEKPRWKIKKEKKKKTNKAYYIHIIYIYMILLTLKHSDSHY